MVGSSKKTISSREMADVLWMFCKDIAKKTCDRNVSLFKAAGVSLDNNETAMSIFLEQFILELWVIFRMFAANETTLDHLRQQYCLVYSKMHSADSNRQRELSEHANKLLTARFEEYSGSWNEKDAANQVLLATHVIENMVGKGQIDWARTLDLIVAVQIDISMVLELVSECRNIYDIQDS